MFQEIFNRMKIYNSSEGITLIEIMVSILFFGIISLSLSHTLTNSLILTGKDGNIVNATNLAKLYLEEVGQDWRLQMDYDDPTLPDISSYTDGEENIITDSTYTKKGLYDVAVTIRDISSNSEGNAIIRRVKISYKDKEENDLITLYKDYGRPGSFVVP